MQDTTLLILASDLRARAGKILTRAETFRNADSREKMRKIAASYEKLAQRLEENAGA
jgi:hypothetical protein